MIKSHLQQRVCAWRAESLLGRRRFGGPPSVLVARLTKRKGNRRTIHGWALELGFTR